MNTQPVEEPRVGLEFNSIEDAKKFYNDYAFKLGFSIRKTYHYKAKKHDDAITSVTYCCSKAGLSKSQTHEKSHCQNSEGSNTPKKQFSNRRSGCKAHIVLRIDDREKWVITVVANEHNHELIFKSLKAHETACQIIREGIDTLTSINQMFESEEATIKEPSSGLHRIVISQSSQVNMLASECTIKDPPQSQCKGKRKPQRFKPPIEKRLGCQELASNVDDENDNKNNQIRDAYLRDLPENGVRDRRCGNRRSWRTKSSDRCPGSIRVAHGAEGARLVRERSCSAQPGRRRRGGVRPGSKL
ncbi:Protein FAR1-RELATED SEQUENCE 12 [Ananas comosus]|uniref:Protein FAR1-RELATED SEQUENCE 12 n=1 Tax=Ananas comosus TaxID=4615 RepID=A0A199UR08_ANACO|nr:Protein FAR1-RELATED SEQUENCE 12 [Ananas comosus]